MTYLGPREIREMSKDERERRFDELQEEMLQLRAQRSLGGATSNYGDFKATQRTIARMLTIMKEDEGED
ncbi:MAG TPA: 50S ribosomal protein L29 [Candidatus Poseidoniales archaeon]|nr:50S ribosomal protein L29 [Candidatus Poseidoniales archaeon]